MKIKLYALLHNDIQSWYTLDFPGGSVSEGQALDILDQAKKQFKIAGKTFIMITSEDVFFITKINKTRQANGKEINSKWKSYKLQKGYVTHARNDEIGDQETDSATGTEG